MISLKDKTCKYEKLECEINSKERHLCNKTKSVFHTGMSTMETNFKHKAANALQNKSLIEVREEYSQPWKIIN